jgi:mutual gliding-motility protein MglA
MLHMSSRLSGKVVFVGPHKSGKTTNVAWISSKGGYESGGSLLRMHVRERMLSVDGDAIAINTIPPAIDVHDDVYGYDFIPITLGPIDDQPLSFSLYALPGHPDAHEAIDRMWRGIDVLVFVADSRRSALEENARSWQRVRTNPWFDPDTICILQLNRRDAPDAVAASELIAALQWSRGPVFEAIASQGIGVRETLSEVVRGLTQKAREVLLAERSE